MTGEPRLDSPGEVFEVIIQYVHQSGPLKVGSEGIDGLVGKLNEYEKTCANMR